MANALIGFSGFVGSNLAKQGKFDEFYNSKNIKGIKGREFDSVICAATPAAKWIANSNPKADLMAVESLMEALFTIKAKKFILISTIDVYKIPKNVDENTQISTENLHPYGTHRRLLELFIAKKFHSYIIRLPGLFGDGLKKNVIYDFLNHNEIEKIDSRGVFQFYDLENIFDDISKVVSKEIRLINFATQPTSVAQICEFAFNTVFKNELEKEPISYDIKSVHADIFGKSAPYIKSESEVLEGIKKFVKRYKNEA